MQRSVDRRDFLRIGGGAAALIALGRCGGSDEVAQGEFIVGSAADFPIDSATLVDDGPFIVIHDADGLYAMSALCTHAACTVSIGDTSFPCECHGSVFDLDGAVISGPAARPLDHYSLVIDTNGDVVVDTTQRVDATTRAPVA